MDCEACNNLLLDFLYDDLDEVRAAAVRRHTDACATCASSVDRLARGRRLARSLQPVEAPAPNASLLEAIQKAAAASRKEAGSSGTGEPPAVAPVVPIERAPRRIPAWLHRVGEVAMRRQVAMAAVFLLMIGFGLRYYQYQSPTRPTGTSDEPSADVIPATELPSAAPASARTTETAPVRRVTAPRAANAFADRSAEHRLQQAQAPAVVPAQPTAPALDELAPTQTAPATAPPLATEEGERAQVAQWNNAQQNNAQQGNGVAPPVAYRNLPPPAPDSVQNVAQQNNAVTDPALLRGLPQAPTAAPFANNDMRQAAAGTNNAWAANNAAPTWQTLQQSADAHRAQNQNDVAASEYRQALAQDPPPADRARIANSLYAALVSAGRVQEANEVRASYFGRTNDANEAANEVTAVQAAAPSNAAPAPRAGTNSNYRAPTSIPHPSRAMPRSRRSAPSNADYASPTLGL